MSARELGWILLGVAAVCAIGGVLCYRAGVRRWVELTPEEIRARGPRGPHGEDKAFTPTGRRYYAASLLLIALCTVAGVVGWILVR